MRRKLSLILVVSIALVFVTTKAYIYFNYTGEIIGVLWTKAYHRDTCQFVKKASSAQLKFFSDIYSALDNGYRPCKSCNPPSDDDYMTKVEKANEQKEIERLQEMKDLYLKGELGGLLNEIELLEKGYITQSDIEKVYKELMSMEKSGEALTPIQRRILESYKKKFSQNGDS